MISLVLCQPLMLIAKNCLWATRLVACRKCPVPGIVDHEDVWSSATRASDVRWHQQANTGLTKVFVGPYVCILMPDGKAQIGYELIDRRAHRPLLVIVDALEQMGLIGRHSRWHRDPKLRQRFPQPTWRPNQARGEWRLRYMSHDLRQFVARCLTAGFDEFDDEGVYVHSRCIIVLDGRCVNWQGEACAKVHHASRFTCTMRSTRNTR